MGNDTVRTSYGALRGAEDRGVTAFLGIPFARPPVGDLRLRPPEPPAPWEGVRTAGTIAAWAPQQLPVGPSRIGGEEVGTSEDCLYLNVWTPGPDPAARRPVMVWIHGGGFMSGSGGGALYNGARLAAAGDVVVVTINYRLGVLGFAAHPDLRDEASGAAGNWGLLDQVAALRWVRNEIAAFGGDPGNVTIFGESAGSMSVATLLGVPAAAGLFHKAIAESGGPNASPMETAASVTETVTEALGLSSVAGLREADIDAVVGAQTGVLAGRRAVMLPFVPVVDGGVIVEDSQTAIAGGASADVPMVIGTNREEMRFFAIGDRAAFGMDEERLARRLARTIDDPGPVTDAYRAARAGRGETASPFELWSAIESDRVFRVPAMRAAEAHARHQPSTFAYLFTYPSPVFDGALGACHALEVPFVFDNLDLPLIAPFAGTGPDVATLSRIMQDSWIAFAHTGDPGWPPYEAGRRATMILDRDSHVEGAPMEEERRFWG